MQLLKMRIEAPIQIYYYLVYKRSSFFFFFGQPLFVPPIMMYQLQWCYYRAATETAISTTSIKEQLFFHTSVLTIPVKAEITCGQMREKKHNKTNKCR